MCKRGVWTHLWCVGFQDLEKSDVFLISSLMSRKNLQASCMNTQLKMFRIWVFTKNMVLWPCFGQDIKKERRDQNPYLKCSKHLLWSWNWNNLVLYLILEPWSWLKSLKIFERGRAYGGRVSAEPRRKRESFWWFLLVWCKYIYAKREIKPIPNLIISNLEDI